jgi:hypothetical protein
MDVSRIGIEEWDMIAEIEGACEPPLIKNQSQVFVQHSKADGGILITELEDAGTFAIERATHDHGEIYRHEDVVDGIKIEERLIIEG